MIRPRELFTRHPGNPILTADDWPYPCNVVFNPGAAQVGDETVVLARVETMSGLSHLTVARSANGIDGWTIDPEPFLAPLPGVESEMWGFEDPRIVWLEELGVFAITCTAYGPGGPAVHLSTTTDFVTVERKGIIIGADDKNAALLPQKVDDHWILFHRPTFAVGGASTGSIALSRSPDLIAWSAAEAVFAPRQGAWWDSQRIGIGPPLLRTEHGWLLIYHGVKEMVGGGIYRVGLALLDLEQPTRLLRRLPEWVLGPGAPYERQGDVPNAIFPCGVVVDPATRLVRLYYGVADTAIALATAPLDDLLDALMASPALGRFQDERRTDRGRAERGAPRVRREATDGDIRPVG